MRTAALLLAVAAVAVAPDRAHGQRLQSSLRPAAVPTVPAAPATPRVDLANDTTPPRRTPLLQRISPAQQIGLAGLVVAGTTLIVANNARARQPVRGGFTVDQRSLVVAGAIVGATVTALWLERRKRETLDAR
jgi:hypothetical protein